MSVESTTPAAAPAGQDGDKGAPSATGAEAGASTDGKGKAAPSILGDDGASVGGEKGSKEQNAGDGSKDGKSAEAGELEIKLPDGIKVDEAILKEFKAIAKDTGLTSENASKLAAWQLERQAKEASAAVESWKKQGEAWADEIAKDKELGGDKLNETSALAKKAIAKFGGQALREAVVEMGIGNHPALVRAFAAIGRAMAEDSSSTGGRTTPAPGKQDHLKNEYPSMFNDDGSPRG